MNVIAIPRPRAIANQPLLRGIVAASAKTCEILALTQRVAASAISTVLVEGETGSGKEVIARLLHEAGPRAAYRFVAVNCAAIPEELLESELFGHEKGAFTDARSQKPGLLEEADQGTLFLDEISQMPPRLQAKLLRVLETQCFRRVGGVTDLRTDTRFVAASNEDLRAAAGQGTFRRDLFYRLNLIQIRIPPLRERREDILPLAAFFIEQFNPKFDRDIEGLAPEARRAFLRYDWPGNVREVRNAIERAMVLEESSYIRPGSLPPEIGCAADRPETDPGLWLARNERRLILLALERADGNRTLAAALLGISRDGLRRRMKMHGLWSQPAAAEVP